MVFFGFLFLLLPLAPAYGDHCEDGLRAELELLTSELLGQSAGWEKLTSQQTQVVEDLLVNVLGRRVLRVAKGTARPCRADATCVMIPREGVKDLDLVINWDEALPPGDYEIISAPGQRILRLPKGEIPRRLLDSREDVITRLALGTRLHPYFADDAIKNAREALGEPRIFRRKVQQEAAETAVETIKRGVRKFLYVAPTGTGKTEVLKAVLRHQLAQSGKKLHILVADQGFVVGQLKKAAVEVGKELGSPPKIIRWGGKDKADLVALAEELRTAPGPVLLVTTADSLIGQVGRSGPALDRIKKELGTLIYDEAHHLGATTRNQAVSELMSGSQAFLYGTTATPDHYLLGDKVIKEIFDDQAYWAYLDHKDDWLTRKGSVSRSFAEVVQQYKIATEKGELVPLSRTVFLDPKLIGDPKLKSFFKGGALDPEQFPILFRYLAPMIAKHERGFFSVGSIDEANELTRAFSAAFPKKKFVALHSGQGATKSENLGDLFEKEGVNFLVTVRQLDEGVDLPDMGLYGDLNPSVGPRQLIQRVGRVSRVAPGKQDVDLVSLMEVTQESLEERIQLLREFRDSELGEQRPPKGAAEQGAQASAPRNPLSYRMDGLPMDPKSYARYESALSKLYRDFWSEKTHGVSTLEEAANKYFRNNKGKAPPPESLLHTRVMEAYRDGTLNLSAMDENLRKALGINQKNLAERMAGMGVQIPSATLDTAVQLLAKGNLRYEVLPPKVRELLDKRIADFEAAGGDRAETARLARQARERILEAESKAKEAAVSEKAAQGLREGEETRLREQARKLKAEQEQARQQEQLRLQEEQARGEQKARDQAAAEKKAGEERAAGQKAREERERKAEQEKVARKRQELEAQEAAAEAARKAAEKQAREAVAKKALDRREKRLAVTTEKERLKLERVEAGQERMKQNLEEAALARKKRLEAKRAAEEQARAKQHREQLAAEKTAEKAAKKAAREKERAEAEKLKVEAASEPGSGSSGALNPEKAASGIAKAPVPKPEAPYGGYVSPVSRTTLLALRREFASGEIAATSSLKRMGIPDKVIERINRYHRLRGVDPASEAYQKLGVTRDEVAQAKIEYERILKDPKVIRHLMNAPEVKAHRSRTLSIMSKLGIRKNNDLARNSVEMQRALYPEETYQPHMIMYPPE